MKSVVVIVLTAFVLVMCSPSTQVTGSWKNPNTKATAATEGIRTILITALTDRTNTRQTVEDDLAAALRAEGFNTIKSMDVLPPTFSNGQSPDRNELLNRIKGTNADAILTIALIDQDTETRHRPGGVTYAPIPRFGYYGTFWGYYNTWSPMLYSPGYYSEDKVYFIETNLYHTETEELLWSAQSETYNPNSLTQFSRDFSRIVVSNMRDEGLLIGASRDELAKETE